MAGLMHVLSFLGSGAFYVPVLLVVFWCVNPRQGARATVALGLSGMVNAVLKAAFHAPRPYWTDPGRRVYEAQGSYGMPSGHAQNAVVAYGLLAFGLRRRWAGAACGLLAAAIGVSRIYLNAHSPGQVVAGWAVGAALLAAVLLLEPVVVPRWVRPPLAVQLALSLAVALGLLGLDALAAAVAHGHAVPALWTARIGHAPEAGLRDGAGAAGTLFGGLAGLSVLARRGWFSAAGPLGRRAARIGVGLLGSVVLAAAGLGLRHAGPAGSFAAQALLALWAAAGAPEVFVRLGLATRDSTPAVTRAGDLPSDRGT